MCEKGRLYSLHIYSQRISGKCRGVFFEASAILGISGIFLSLGHENAKERFRRSDQNFDVRICRTDHFLAVAVTNKNFIIPRNLEEQD